MEPITRRCLSCRKDLTLNHYDLTGPKPMRVCNACVDPWPGARLAIQSMHVALGKDIPRLARALGYTHGTAEAYLYGRERMNTRASHRVRLAYEEMRIADNGITLRDSAEELAEKAKQRARMERRRAQVHAQALATHDEPPCPKLACGHGEEAHTLSGFCTELDCPCGESEVMDTRARDAIAGGDWEMAQEEMERRGLERHS